MHMLSVHTIPILALLAAGVQASVLTLQSPRFTITSSNATQLRSEPISTVKKPSPELSLGPTDTLKLTFQVLEKDDGKGVQPHQTFLRFYDPISGEEGIQPIRVTSGGKAKFELNMARPPASIPPTTTDPLQVSLYLGSFVHSPAAFSLFDLHLPPSQPAPQHPDETSYHSLPPIVHTFRKDPTLPPRPVSAVSALLVLAPWFALIGFWSHIHPAVPHLLSPSIVPFALSLASFEGLLVWYWVAGKLGQVLVYGAVLGVISALTGKQALAAIGQRRTGTKSS